MLDRIPTKISSISDIDFESEYKDSPRCYYFEVWNFTIEIVIHGRGQDSTIGLYDDKKQLVNIFQISDTDDLKYYSEKIFSNLTEHKEHPVRLFEIYRTVTSILDPAYRILKNGGKL